MDKVKKIMNQAEAKKMFDSLAGKPSLFELNLFFSIYKCVVKHMHSEPFLGVFTSMVKVGNTITCSIDDLRRIKDYQLLGLKASKKNFFRDVDYEIDESAAVGLDKVNELSFIERAHHVITNVFSDSIIQENGIDRESLSGILEELRLENQENLEKKLLPTVYRLEENRNDLRIVLLLAPVEGGIKLSFTGPASNGIFNPITTYYEKRFSYEYKRYNRFCTNHTAEWYEFQEYSTYRLSNNNKQIFKTRFNLYSEGDMNEVMRKSMRSLKRQLSEMLLVMELLYGADFYGRYDLNTRIDSLNVENRPVKMMGTIWDGTRVYTHPLYDIFIQFTPSIEVDDNDKQFMIGLLVIRIKPFDNREHQTFRYCHHPVIYDAMK